MMSSSVWILPANRASRLNLIETLSASNKPYWEDQFLFHLSMRTTWMALRLGNPGVKFGCPSRADNIGTDDSGAWRPNHCHELSLVNSQVIVVVAVMDGKEVFVPTIVTLYVPFAALLELDEDPEPQANNPNVKAASPPNFFGLYPASPTSSASVMPRPALVVVKPLKST